MVDARLPSSSTEPRIVAADGLTTADATERLRAGLNELPQRAPTPLYRRLLAQVTEPMALLLLAAAAVSWFGLGERLDAMAIAAIGAANVAVAVAVAMVQEGKTPRALESLRQMEAGGERLP